MSNSADTRAMKPETKRWLKPNLRFPEFRNGPEWKEAKLGELISAITPPTKLQSSEYLPVGEFPIVDQSQDYICGWTDDAKAVINESLPLIVFGDHTCVLKLLRQPFAQGADGIKVLKAKDNISAEYLYHSMSYCPLTMEDYKRHFSTLKERRVLFPDIKSGEQKKIADCLTLLDKVIDVQARKVEVLKTHKRGLMQQLFPREVETTPRLRFPQFQHSPEWISDSLGNIFETSSGGTPERSVKEYWNGRIPWITTSRVDFNVICKSDEFISEMGLQNSSAKLFQKKTVLIAMYGQGKTRGKVALLGIEATTNQACAAILPREDIDPYFVFLNLAGRYDEMRGLSNSGGQENLSQGLIKGLPFSYPNDIAEQQQISACLSSLDELITAQTEKLEALKTHKQGLMQQVFPSPEEVEA